MVFSNTIYWPTTLDLTSMRPRTPKGRPTPSHSTPSLISSDFFSFYFFRPVREKFIRAKYAEKKFIETSPLSPDELAAEMYTAIAVEDDAFPVFQRLMQGADINWNNPDDEMKTPTHCAVIFDKISCLEILIQNGADIFAKETRDWTPMVCCMCPLFYFASPLVSLWVFL